MPSVPDHNGNFRTPTLRNVADTAPYMHNGVFNDLLEVMAFYNVCADAPEVANAIENPDNFNADIGNLNLNAGQIDDLIAFMDVFSDN